MTDDRPTGYDAWREELARSRNSPEALESWRRYVARTFDYIARQGELARAQRASSSPRRRP